MAVLSAAQRLNVTGRCHRCGQRITDGLYGDLCGARLGRAVEILAASALLPAQRAAQDIIEGRLAPVAPGAKVYRYTVPHVRGEYLVSEETCSCPAGHYGTMCHHRMAATVLAA